jgi:predicted nucleic acid-binding protein
MQQNYFDKIIISDTSCLIVLTNIGRLDILRELCRSVMITPEVAKEFGEPLPEWITVVAVRDTKKTEAFRQFLDEGESSAIALAFEIGNSLLIVDDRQARAFAKRLGLEITGTLGLLRSAHQSGLIKDINTVIDDLKRCKFRIPADVEKYL